MGLDEGAAEEHLPHQPGAVEGGDLEAVGHQDGGLRLPKEPGGVNAPETPGGDRTGWQHHPLKLPIKSIFFSFNCLFLFDRHRIWATTVG